MINLSININKPLFNSENEISIKWGIEDVKDVAEDLTDNECREVLRLAKVNHDATVGINWDVLEVWADEVRGNRERGNL